MENLACRMEDPGAVLATAVVEGMEGESWWLRSAGSGFAARRAAGCLVMPQVGDLVLVAHLAGGEGFILSVLQRAEEQAPLRLESDSGLELRSGRGGLDLAAAGEINLVAGERLGLGAPRLDCAAERGSFAITHLELWSRSLQAGLEAVRLKARSLRSSVEHLMASFKSRFTRVEGLDRLEAATIDQQAEDLFSAHGRYSQLTAEEDLQVDGSMIHLG